MIEPKLTYSLIYAHTDTGLMGIRHSNRLPWGYIKEDMQRFLYCTRNRIMVCGRNTFIEDDLVQLNLNGRKLIILTSDPDSFRGLPVDMYTAMNLAEVDAIARELIAESNGELENEIMVIGGAQVLKAYACRATTIYQTIVHTPYGLESKYRLANIYAPELRVELGNLPFVRVTEYVNVKADPYNLQFVTHRTDCSGVFEAYVTAENFRLKTVQYNSL